MWQAPKRLASVVVPCFAEVLGVMCVCGYVCMHVSNAEHACAHCMYSQSRVEKGSVGVAEMRVAVIAQICPDNQIAKAGVQAPFPLSKAASGACVFFCPCRCVDTVVDTDMPITGLPNSVACRSARRTAWGNRGSFPHTRSRDPISRFSLRVDSELTCVLLCLAYLCSFCARG